MRAFSDPRFSLPATPRLKLRLATRGDADFFLDLLNDAAYVANIRDSGVRTLENARAFVEEKYIASYRDHGFGLYVMESLESGDALGVCGFVKRPELADVDLGFALLERMRGQGLTLEACQALLPFAHDTLGLRRLAALTLPSNAASRRLLLKLGFTLAEERALKAGGEIVHIFSRTLPVGT